MQVPHTEVLVSCGGAEVARHVFEPGEYSIGRETDCAIHLDDSTLSPRHARLTLNHDHAVIEDMGSGSGTFVNEHPVTGPTRLWSNQKIRLGTEITLSLRRLKDAADSDHTLPPVQATVKRILPEDFFREKKYEIGEMVARGGMGAILKALEATTERTVAMKVMLESLSSEDVVRFIGEAKVTAQLEHPNIVPIYELGVDANDQVFYTMKFVRGVTLSDVLDRLAAGDKEAAKEFSLARLLTIFQKVCDAVAFAHGRGVIHRDLKPANVMIGDYGEVLVMDWGLAKLVERPKAGSANSSMRTVVRMANDPESAFATMSGTVMGTPQYMSPEQALGEIETLDARTDIYALGAILYHILALRPSVKGGNAQKVLARVRLGEIDPLVVARVSPHAKADEDTRPTPSSASRIPDSLAAVVRKAMALDKEDRYPDVGALQDEIEAYQNGFATHAEAAGLFRQIDLALRRHKKEATILTACFCLLVTGSVFAYIRVHGERDLALAEKARAEKNLDDLRKTAPTFFEQAKLLTEQEKFPEALEKIDIALTLNPHEPSFLNQRGNILQSMERFPEAAEAYTAALRLAPSNSNAKANLELSRSLASKKSSEGALSSADRVQWRDLLQKQGRYAEAIFASRSLAADAIKMLPAWQAKLDSWLGRDVPRIKVQSNGFYLLDLSNRSITDLSPLRGMPVTFLNISGNPRIKDLNPLIDSPLVELSVDAYGSNLSDLSPLRGKNLQALSISGTKVNDLEALSGMKNLMSLNITNMAISDLTPIRDAHLKYLSGERTRIRDIKPLQGQPLEHVNLNGTMVQSLEPLADAPLEELMVEYCPRLDLASLKTRGLRMLLAANTILDHSEILGEMQNLEVITLPENLTDPGSLRHLPHLRKIDRASYGGVSGQIERLKDAADFWREYDAQQPVRAANATLHARLKEYMTQPGWRDDRIQQQPDNTFAVDLSTIKLGDLSVLTGMPISSLNMNKCQLQDLRPIAALPLVSLTIENTQVSDLSPLRGMRLRSLDLANCPITDTSIEVLRGMPLEHLHLTSTGITDLSPLAGMPLQEVYLSNLKIRDFKPLRGMPIKHLFARSGAKFPNIEPLRGLPLVTVNLDGSSPVSVAPLSGCPALESVVLPPHARDVETLRSLPNLRAISFEPDGSAPDNPSKTAQEFWREFDAKKEAVK